MNDISNNPTIREHNQKAAAMWSGPGRAYNEVSRTILSAIEHCVDRLAPVAGEHVVDVATGIWPFRSLRWQGNPPAN